MAPASIFKSEKLKFGILRSLEALETRHRRNSELLAFFIFSRRVSIVPGTKFLGNFFQKIEKLNFYVSFLHGINDRKKSVKIRII